LVAFAVLSGLIVNESVRAGVKLKEIKGWGFFYKNLEPYIREDRKKTVRFFVTSSGVLFLVHSILYSLSALLYHLQNNQA
jgi:hypothetical protein